MGGFSSVTGLETIVFADNASFDGTQRGGAITTNGQLFIGSTSSPHIQVGTLTSPDSSVTIGYSSPNITLEVASGGSGITTLAGDVGTATGSTVNIITSLATNGSGSISFNNFGVPDTLFLSLADNFNSIYLGSGAGNPLGTPSSTATGNISLGVSSFGNVTTSPNNVGIGDAALSGLQGGNGSNVGVGTSVLQSLVSGDTNIAIGLGAGGGYTGAESSNILIGNNGTVGESNVIRIGTQGTSPGQQNVCYVAGITGATPTSGNTPQVVLCDNAGNLAPISSSTAGFVLTSNGTATPSFQAASGGSVTIAGDTGTISGTSLTIYANQATQNCGSSVSFSNSSTTSTLNLTDSLSNVILGNLAGNATLTGTSNVGVGITCLASLTTGVDNIAIGKSALNATANGNHNVAVGTGALQSNISGGLNTALGDDAMTDNLSGSDNTAIGQFALGASTTGAQNTVIGYQAGFGLGTGNSNILIGAAAGGAYTTNESNNIVLFDFGTVGESNTIRIGAGGTQTSCFIGGINGVTVTGSAVLCDTNGQLGTVASSERYKTDIESLSSQSILDLRPVSFKYKGDRDIKTHYGMIAEEVDKVFPDLVIYDQEGKPHSIAYHEMPALLLKEIQRLHERIKTLESKI